MFFTMATFGGLTFKLCLRECTLAHTYTLTLSAHTHTQARAAEEECLSLRAKCARAEARASDGAHKEAAAAALVEKHQQWCAKASECVVFLRLCVCCFVCRFV